MKGRGKDKPKDPSIELEIDDDVYREIFGEDKSNTSSDEKETPVKRQRAQGNTPPLPSPAISKQSSPNESPRGTDNSNNTSPKNSPKKEGGSAFAGIFSRSLGDINSLSSIKKDLQRQFTNEMKSAEAHEPNARAKLIFVGQCKALLNRTKNANTHDELLKAFATSRGDVRAIDLSPTVENPRVDAAKSALEAMMTSYIERCRTPENNYIVWLQDIKDKLNTNDMLQTAKLSETSSADMLGDFHQRTNKINSADSFKTTIKFLHDLYEKRNQQEPSEAKKAFVSILEEGLRPANKESPRLR